MSYKVVSCRNLACCLDVIRSFLFPSSLDTVSVTLLFLWVLVQIYGLCFHVHEANGDLGCQFHSTFKRNGPSYPCLLQSYSHMGIFLAHNSVLNLHFPTYFFSSEKQSGGRKTSCIFVLFIIFCEQKYSFLFFPIKHMVG